MKARRATDGTTDQWVAKAGPSPVHAWTRTRTRTRSGIAAYHRHRVVLDHCRKHSAERRGRPVSAFSLDKLSAKLLASPNRQFDRSHHFLGSSRLHRSSARRSPGPQLATFSRGRGDRAARSRDRTSSEAGRAIPVGCTARIDGPARRQPICRLSRHCSAIVEHSLRSRGALGYEFMNAGYPDAGVAGARCMLVQIRN